MFVEAISFNVRDLKEFLVNNSAADRSHVIHGAATDVCVNSTITVQRPRLEEKSKSIAHWMRRQIGSIASKNHLLPKVAQQDRKTWATEEVRCVTGAIILKEWATVLCKSTHTHHLCSATPTVPGLLATRYFHINTEGASY